MGQSFYRRLRCAVRDVIRPWQYDYDSDNLRVSGKWVPFMSNPHFMESYRAGIAAHTGTRGDQHIEWRAAVLCWAAKHATQLPGDFVECGVCEGSMSLTICHYVDFNATGKQFWLFDTFEGIPLAQATASTAEKSHAAALNEELYSNDVYERAKANFAPYPRAHLVRGLIPDTLESTEIESVSYLHIDMNIAYPERKALEFFWPKLTPGALVILDDYGWRGYEAQRETADDFARSVGTEILCLPTAQGLMIKAR